VDKEPILIGERIAELRIGKGLTQTELASAVGVSQSSVSQMELGKVSRVDAWIVAKLAQALETTMDYLLAMTDDPSPRRSVQRLAVDEAIRQVLILSPAARDALAEFLRLARLEGQTEPERGCTE
jgi:transcriptional regulator with XRE-family HTH domain